MNTQTLKAKSPAFATVKPRTYTVTVPFYEWINQFGRIFEAWEKRDSNNQGRKSRSYKSGDALRSLPVEEKQRLGLYHLMD